MSRPLTLAEIARRVGAEVVGEGDREVVGVRPLDEAGPEHLSFLHNPRYARQALASRAGALLVADAGGFAERDLLVSNEPYLALARVLELFHPPARPAPGVHPSAVVAPEATIADDASVGPQAVVGAGAAIAARAVVGAGCVIGSSAVVGEGTLLHPRVTIADRCRIGARCVIHSGTVIGSDGFGFATVDGEHHKVPQVGIVVVEDEVELGANVCVDRATLGETRIGRGTKVDNLVQIAHNVVIGEGTLLVAQVGLSGSTRLGHHVVMAGQSGAAGHLRLGDRVVVGAKSAVYKDVPDGAFVTGIPAQPHRDWLKANANLRRLELLRDRLRALEEKVAMLAGDPRNRQ